MSLNVYLFFDGTCREAFNFYQQTFGGEFAALQTYADDPEEMQVPDAARDKVMHISLPLGDSLLMGSDRFPGEPTTHIVGNNFSIAVPARSRAECDTWFATLGEGGTVQMSLQETFWGSYFGRLTDRYDTSWMFNFDLTTEPS